jgi:hypothetical protein
MKLDPAQSGLRLRIRSKPAMCEICRSNRAEYEVRLWPQVLSSICGKCRKTLYTEYESEEEIPYGYCSVSAASAALESITGKSALSLYTTIYKLTSTDELTFIKWKAPTGKSSKYVELRETWQKLKKMYKIKTV